MDGKGLVSQFAVTKFGLAWLVNEDESGLVGQ